MMASTDFSTIQSKYFSIPDRTSVNQSFNSEKKLN